MGRIFRALIANGLSSAISLILSVLMARTGGTEELGKFGVAFAAFMLVQLIVRDAGANTVGAVLPSKRRIRWTARRVSLMGFLFSIPVLVAGLVLAYPYVVIAAIAIHGLCLYDYSKTLSLSLDDGKIALAQDGVYFFVFMVAALLAFLGHLDSVGLMLVWALTGSILGYVASWLQSFKIAPLWYGDSDESRNSLVFGFQSLIGSGSVHVITFLLGAIGGPGLVGALRGASTIIGPANVVTSSLQPLLVTYFARTAPRPGHLSLRTVVRSALGLAAAHLLLASCLVVLGFNFGEFILGDAWSSAAPLLLIVAVDSALVAVGTAPLAAHRSIWASGRLARINIAMVVTRMPIVLTGAVIWGALGASAGFLVATSIASICWWVSFVQLQRAQAR